MTKCKRCGTAGYGETATLLKTGWQVLESGDYCCPECTGVPDEITPEVSREINYCTLCKGPCQGH